MGTYETHISQRAQSDIREIAAYIIRELQQPDAARRLVEALAEGIASLTQMPERFAVVADARLAGMGVRKMKVGHHLVFFSIDTQQRRVCILGILYERREWETTL